MSKKLHGDSFPLNTEKFLVGVVGMKDDAIGQYIKLLCLQHQKGHLNEEEFKAYCPKMTPQVLNKFAMDMEGKYYNEVLEEVLESQKKIKEKQQKNGSQNGAKTEPNLLPKSLKREAKTEPNVDKIKFFPNNIIIYNNIEYKLSNYRNIIPPSIFLVDLYCKSRKNEIDAEYFVDYYTARGWCYGKNKTKIIDWQAVIRTWEQQSKKREEENNEGEVFNITQMRKERHG